MVRSILAVFLGLIFFMLSVMVLEHLNHAIYPPPAGVDLHKPDSVHSAMANMPAGALVLLVLGWAVGTIAGAWLAATITRRAPIAHGLIIGGCALASAILIMVMIPHPLWIWAAALVSIPAAAYAGAWLASRGKAPSVAKI